MKYFILSGEASGDLHSAALAEAVYRLDPAAEIAGWGGDEMRAAGVRILKHYRDLAFMGFVEVVRHLPEILRNFRIAKAQITAFAPDALILTDYPGFNLRIAKWAHRKGIKVYYYISPQLWAWKEGRVEIIRRYVDRMYVILPFEQPFYQRHGIDVVYVGHPLAWRIGQMKPVRQKEKRLILLPGSRRREIRDMLPVMLKAAAAQTGYRIYVAGAPAIPVGFYYEILKASGVPGVTLTLRHTYALLRTATAALCTSGTATLETALFGVPQVVCYKGDRLSYLIARRLIKVPFIAMANLVCGREVIPELIQDDFNVQKLSETLHRIMQPEVMRRIQDDYTELRARLDSGNPADKVAVDLLSQLKAS